MICTLLGTAMFVCGKQRRRIQKEHIDLLWRKIISDHQALNTARIGLCALSNILCIIGIVISLYFIYCSLIVSSGLLAAQTGAYELCERIFVIRPNFIYCEGNMTIVGTWEGKQKSEPHSPRELLVTEAIAKVYGEGSEQVAHRYLLLGERYRCNGVKAWQAGRDASAAENFQISLKWYRKASSLFRLSKNSDELIEVLSNISYCQIKLGCTKEAVRTFEECCALISTHGSDENLGSALDRLALVANYAERNKESHSLRKRAKQVANKENQDIIDDTYNLLVTFVSAFLDQ
jgi:tetratricopeptide (TPR) repeat protein